MGRVVHAAFLLAIVCAPRFALSSQEKAPALPFIDRGACPGEYCRYTEWTVTKRITVYDTWEPRRKSIATVAEGQKVTGLTGLVITRRPGRIRMDRDVPEHGLKRGDLLLTYAYRGEGFSAVWVNGRYESDFDISFSRWPDGSGCGGDYCAATYLDLGDKAWWAQVRLASGQTGWVDMDHSDIQIVKFD